MIAATTDNWGEVFEMSAVPYYPAAIRLGSDIRTSHVVETVKSVEYKAWTIFFRYKAQLDLMSSYGSVSHTENRKSVAYKARALWIGVIRYREFCEATSKFRFFLQVALQVFSTNVACLIGNYGLTSRTSDDSPTELTATHQLMIIIMVLAGWGYNEQHGGHVHDTWNHELNVVLPRDTREYPFNLTNLDHQPRSPTLEFEPWTFWWKSNALPTEITSLMFSDSLFNRVL